MSVALSVLTLARLCAIRSHLTTEAVLSSRQEGTTNANYRKSLDQYPVDTGRLRRVVEVVAERSGWAHKKPGQGRALGFAAHRSFLSYVAAVVDVEVDQQGQVRIPRVELAGGRRRPRDAPGARAGAV